MELFRYLIFFLMLLGFLSVLLWPPALCLGLFLLARERRARPALGGVRRWPREWVRLGTGLGCALAVLAVLSVGGFWLGFTGCAEEVGEWQGRKVVMQEPGWTEGIYYYYRYDGPFLLGESLGWSEVPWDIQR